MTTTRITNRSETLTTNQMKEKKGMKTARTVFAAACVAGLLAVGATDVRAILVSYTAEGDTTYATDQATGDGAQNGAFDANTGVNFGWRPYWFGLYSYDMNGTPPDGITIPGSASLGTAFTVAAWYARNSDASGQTLFSNYDGGGVDSTHLLFDVDPGAVPSGSSAMRFFINGVLVGTPDGVALFSGQAPQPNGLDGWHHHAATYDNGAVTLYLDGVAVASGTAGSGAPVMVDDLRVGRDLVGSNLQGFVDDIAILDRALTAGEIASLYTFGNDAFSFEPQVPEPSVMMLLGLGGLLAFRRRK